MASGPLDSGTKAFESAVRSRVSFTTKMICPSGQFLRYRVPLLQEEILGSKSEGLHIWPFPTLDEVLALLTSADRSYTVAA